MDTPPTLDRLAEIIATAPGWTRVGISAPDPRTRERATDALAAFLVEQLDAQTPAFDPRQVSLPL